MRGVALAEQKALISASHEQLLRTVCAWLVANQMRSEDVQARGVPRSRQISPDLLLLHLP